MRDRTKTKGILVDLTLCIGCRGCQTACKQWNERGARKTELSENFTNPSFLNSDTYTIVRFIETEYNNTPVWDFIKVQCMHCKDPACASVCPVGAIKKTDEGPVIYHDEKCIGCRYCMLACPFQIPKYEWEKTSPFVHKCTFCPERIANNMVPACAKTCPTQAILYGNYNEILSEAEKRLRENSDRYVNHIYGMKEAGGTSWLYLSNIPFEKLGFNAEIPNLNLPDFTWAPLSKIPYMVGGLITILSIIAYMRNRGTKEETPEPKNNNTEPKQ